MTIRKPTKDILFKISEQYNFYVTDEELESFQSAIEGALTSYQHIERMVEPSLPVNYSREKGYRPGPKENEWNAWYWKTSVLGEENGKLRGKKVVLKDNISLAGIPMMNGSSLLEGYIPDHD